MKTIVKKYLPAAILIVLSFLQTVPSLGCSTPVFRYALEMWPAFNYRIEVIHNGNLSSEQILAFEKLKNASISHANSNITVLESSDFKKFKIEENTIPQILLLHPTEQGNNNLIWQGDLTKENVSRIIDSPARQKIIGNIQKGDAITWVLVEGTDKEKNEEAYNTLKRELEVLSKELKLASDATDVEGNPLDINIINQGVHFSMLSIARDNPEEEVFIQMLLHTEPDLPFIKAPMAFPVFGRGRVLFALVGKGIKQKLIEATCNSVIGWCSCTIKEDNPGADLLFTANWDEVAGDSTWIQEVELPEITGMSGFIQNEPEVKTETEKAKEEIAITAQAKEIKQVKKVVKEETEQKENKVESVSTTVNPEKTETELTAISFSEKSGYGPLTRNITIVVVLLLIAMPLISLYLRKKRS